MQNVECSQILRKVKLAKHGGPAKFMKFIVRVGARVGVTVQN
jgi:hypothetical protein